MIFNMHKRKKRKRSYEYDCRSDCSIPYIPIIPRRSIKVDDIETDACKCSLKANDENYKMNHKKRGKAIIFNHYLCQGHSQPRKGTECDVMRLGRSLSYILKFEVRVYQDLKHAEIMDVLEKLSKENFASEDCMAVFVLTHGNLHGLTAADKRYNIDDLWNNFLPTKCPSLAGKPKLFFINACRGGKYDQGFIHKNYDAEENNEEEFADKCNLYRAPIYADFLTFYSTMEGYTSLRHPVHGTWFIQSLCETLDNKNYRKLELKQILTVTARKTALKCNENNDTVCQIPTLMSTLIRNVYFF